MYIYICICDINVIIYIKKVPCPHSCASTYANLIHIEPNIPGLPLEGATEKKLSEMLGSTPRFAS